MGSGKNKIGKITLCFEMAEAQRHGSDQERGGNCE